HEGHVGRGECQVVQDPHIVQGDVGRGGRHLYEIAELLADRRAAPGGHLGQGSWRLDHQRGGVSSRTEEDRTVNVRVVTGAGPRLAVGVVPVRFAWLETTAPSARFSPRVASKSIWIWELVVAPPGRVRPVTVTEPGIPPMGWVTLVDPPAGVTVRLEMEPTPAGRLSVMVMPFIGGQVKFWRSRV